MSADKPAFDSLWTKEKERYPVILRLELSLPEGKGQLRLSVHNLSRGGAWVKGPIPKSLKVDDLIDFVITDPQDLTLSFSGRGNLRWLKPSYQPGSNAELGMEFVSLSEAAKACIEEIIRASLPEIPLTA